MRTPKDKLHRAIEIARKWEDPNEGATTEELKELHQLSVELVDDVIKYIKNREEEDV